MSKLSKLIDEKKCIHDFRAPSVLTIRSPEFKHELAKALKAKGISANAIVDSTFGEICEKHEGKLHGLYGEVLRLKDNPELTDEVFGEDERSFVRRMIDHAEKMPKYRTQERILFPMLLLYYGVLIHHCRTDGECS